VLFFNKSLMVFCPSCPVYKLSPEQSLKPLSFFLCSLSHSLFLSVVISSLCFCLLFAFICHYLKAHLSFISPEILFPIRPLCLCLFLSLSVATVFPSKCLRLCLFLPLPVSVYLWHLSFSQSMSFSHLPASVSLSPRSFSLCLFKSLCLSHLPVCVCVWLLSLSMSPSLFLRLSLCLTLADSDSVCFSL